MYLQQVGTLCEILAYTFKIIAQNNSMRMPDSLKINHAPLIKHVMLEFCLPQLMLSKIPTIINLFYTQLYPTYLRYFVRRRNRFGPQQNKNCAVKITYIIYTDRLSAQARAQGPKPQSGPHNSQYVVRRYIILFLYLIKDHESQCAGETECLTFCTPFPRDPRYHDPHHRWNLGSCIS